MSSTMSGTTTAIPDAGTAKSAVSWGAVFAGATTAGALSLILLVLGVGLGFSAMSPWADQGASAGALGISTIVWAIFTAAIASALGGYIAGRLRVRWLATPTDEVHFRDTAHGMLAWAVATLFTAALLTSSIGAIVGAGVKAGGSVIGAAGTTVAAAAGGAVAGATSSDSGGGLGYFTDTLFRKDASAPGDPAAPAPTREVTGILVQAMKSGSLSPDDTRYVGQLVAQRTGLSQQDAEKRVADTFAKAQAAANDAANKAREAADKAKKAGAYASLWVFVSLLVGAFCASFAATIGGRGRDLY